MSHRTSTVNFLIHDTNGQPRMVKVVHNSNKEPIAHIKSNPIKIIKVSAGSTIQNPVYRTVKLSGVQCSNLVPVKAERAANLQNIIPKTEPIDPEEIEIQIEPIVPEPIVQPSETPPFLAEQCTTASSTGSENNLTMSYASRRRNNTDNDQPTEYTTKRRKYADKVGKGLRHFSMKVCEKVRTKGFTSYNEVADELVAEFSAGIHGSADSQHYDQKNIRRRVYDALNVLMAMNIISKEKKEIRWIGLPTNSIQECTTLEKEKQSTIERIEKKTQQLQELILQHISFKSLIERNIDTEGKGVKPSPSSAIHLPFIVVNTSDKALIDCSISNDKTEYMFNFNRKFQIHDDIDILKRMGLLFGLDKGECSEEEIARAKSMVPTSLEHYVERMGKGLPFNVTDLFEDTEDEELDDEEGLDVEADADADGDDAEADGHDSDDSNSDVCV